MPQAATFLLDFLCGVAASFALGSAVEMFPRLAWIPISFFILIGISLTPAGHAVWCSMFPSASQAMTMRLLIFFALATGLILSRL